MINARIRALGSRLAEPDMLLPLLLIGAFIVRGVWIDVPPGALIFDESYYVNAARILLGWPVEAGATYAGAAVGLDPNIEHPPLGKLLMALSMVVFGDNGLGWRLPSLVAGMLVLGALYGIVRSTGETPHLAILAVGFLAFDNLTLVHSRLGTLDMLVLAPILIGAWLGLRERWALAGVLIAVGFLVKLTAVYALVALLLLLLIRIAEGLVAAAHAQPSRPASSCLIDPRVLGRRHRGAVDPGPALHDVSNALRSRRPHGQVRRQPEGIDRPRGDMRRYQQRSLAVAIQHVSDQLPACGRYRSRRRGCRDDGAIHRLPGRP